MIRAMRDRAAAFSKQFPNDVRGPAAELLLSKWLKDDDLVEGLYAKLAQLDPDNAEVRASLAKLYKEQNRYQDALNEFKAQPPDPQKSFAAVVSYAECLFAEHQFEAAAELLATLPDTSASLSLLPTKEAETLRQNAREYVSLWAQEQDIRKKEEAADDLPRVLLVTSRGQVTLELFENQAPNTVANFISLIDQGFYNGSKFHRVIPNFMAQGGDPNSKPGNTGTAGQGDPGYFIPDETSSPDHRLHFAGSLSMAKTEAPNTGGCQFFITVAPTPHLNGKHTVFGRVIEGLDVARSLKQEDVIEMMTVTRRRDHEYKPNIIAKPALPSEAVTTQPIDETPTSAPATMPDSSE